MDIYYYYLYYLMSRLKRAQKIIYFTLLVVIASKTSACPVCFCNELGWPEHITVTYNIDDEHQAEGSTQYKVEILCAPQKTECESSSSSTHDTIENHHDCCDQHSYSCHNNCHN